MDKGSIIKINYVERVKTTGKVTETNIESVAKEAGIYDSDNPSRYRPTPTVVGSGRPTKGVDEALLGMQVGDRKRLQVPPEKAFGPRNPKLMDHAPMSSFIKQGIRPVRGLPVRTRRGLAIVRSTTGGRILLDFNHPLAGQTLDYDVEVTGLARDLETKIRWVIEMRLPGIDSESHLIELSGNKLVVELNSGGLSKPVLERLQPVIKRSILENVPEVAEVSFGPVEMTEVPAGGTGEGAEGPTDAARKPAETSPKANQGTG